MKTEQRFRFEQDDSCHWYAIPAGKTPEFERWVSSFEDEADDYDGEDFEQYRLDSSHPSNYTFTNLQEDMDERRVS